MERLRYGHVSALPEESRLVYGYGPDKRQLVPCERITDPNLRVGVLSANNLLPARFLLVSKDRQPITLSNSNTGTIFRLTYPGKSAFLYFGDDPDKGTVIDLVQFNMKREAKRDDHLHLTTVGKIEEAGWQAWWTPLPDRKNMMHVRLVANGTAESGKSPEIEEATALCAAFSRAI